MCRALSVALRYTFVQHTIQQRTLVVRSVAATLSAHTATAAKW